MIMKNRIKKLEDGRTVFYLNWAQAYVLHEGNLENTLEEIRKLDGVHSIYEAIVYAVVTTGVIGTILVTLSEIIFSGPVPKVDMLLMLFLCVLLSFMGQAINKLYYPIVKDCEKIETKATKKLKILLIVFCILLLLWPLLLFMQQL